MDAPKIALCLITKNSEAVLEACLASFRPFVDGVFVYDTGSTDGTLDLLAALGRRRWLGLLDGRLDGTWAEDEEEPASQGAESADGTRAWLPLAPIVVEQGEWRDDFAWARTQSFAMPDDTYDWVAWADDDDILEGGPWLRQLAATAHPTIDGFVLQYDYARDEAGNCVCVLWRERLLRRDRGYTWQNPVHEVLVPPDGHEPHLVMLPPEQTRYVHHRPPDRYSSDRNLQILLAAKDRADRTGEQPDPRTLAYLGTEMMAHQRFADAVGYLQAYIEHPGAGWADERMQVHHKLAACLRVLGNPLAAVEVEMQALRERDDWAETYVGLCESFAQLGRWDRCERWALRALELGMPRSMLILNPLEFTFVPYARLSEACVNTGREQEALAWLERAAALAPQHPLIRERRQAYERARFESELVRAVLTLREAAVRFDENLKALRIMENVPYLVAERPEIVKARADQREMCRHFLEPEEYLRWYSEEPKESTRTDDHIDLVADAFGRVGGLLEGLAEQEAELGRKPVVLDLGCNDWWMGEALARKGYRCDGVELNRRSYEKAVERRDRFGRDATIVHGDLHNAATLLAEANGARVTDDGVHDVWVLPEELRYDAVSLFEVIEHVPDPAATLAVCESLLRPGGRVYLSTPNGAFEHGNLPDWARVERKGHLRAIPMHELAELIAGRGTVQALVDTDGDRVAFAAYTPGRKQRKVVLYAGGGWEPWSPASIFNGGLGGSETALVQVATRLAQRGHEVKVFSGSEPGLYAGALYRPHTAWDPTERCDLLIVSRLPHVFDNPIGAARTALWCHDHSYPGALTEARAEKIDHIVTLSEWQRDRFERLYPFAADRLRLIRNGISVVDPESGETRFPDAGRQFTARQPRCVYSSSADRGLDVLLELWPEIRRRVPDAELHVFYGWDVFDRVAMVSPALWEYKARVMHLLEEAGGEAGGVVMRGRVGQPVLAAELQLARAWTYPTAFLETSCIGAMEARAAGLPIVTSDLAALQETVGAHGILVGWGPDEDAPQNREPVYREAFVEATVRLLSDEVFWRGWHRRAGRGVEGLDWSGRVAEWEALVEAADRAMVAA